MNRVVVTGLGVISPVGNDVAAFWQSLIEGKCGIGPITAFDTTEYKVKIAAEVKDFDPLQYLDKAEGTQTGPIFSVCSGGRFAGNGRQRSGKWEQY